MRRDRGMSRSNTRPTRTGEFPSHAGTGEFSRPAALQREATRSGRHTAIEGWSSNWTIGVAAFAAVTAALIFVAWAKMQTVQYTYQIDGYIDTEEELGNRQRLLRAELAALRSPAALHALAADLGLAPPEPGHVVVVTGDPEGLNAVLVEDSVPAGDLQP
ncbi:MAG: hypothetical protein VX498_14420 [Myxococcota bacterium]|nr:hypothetical protein [Myxococcota bacterium]